MQFKDFSMKLRRSFLIMILLNLSFVSLADEFDDEFNGMNANMNEMDLETGSCLPELKAQTEQATKMLALLSQKKNKIASLEGKVDNLTAKLIARSKAQVCNTSGLSQQVSSFQLSNAQLKRENSNLKLKIAQLQSETTLGQGSTQSRSYSSVVSPVVPSTVSTINADNVSPDAKVIDATWGSTAGKYSGRLGQDFTYICPPNGTTKQFYGGLHKKYQVSSSVCTAAVYENRMTLISGGTVSIRIIDNKSGYPAGKERKGIYPRSGQHRGSRGFVFL